MKRKNTPRSSRNLERWQTNLDLAKRYGYLHPVKINGMIVIRKETMLEHGMAIILLTYRELILTIGN